MLEKLRFFASFIYLGGKDRIRRAKAHLPFLLARNTVSKLPIFSRFVVRSNLRFSSCRQKQNKALRAFFCFWRKGQDSNLRMFPSLVFKTSAFNHSATFPHIIIPYSLHQKQSPTIILPHLCLFVNRQPQAAMALLDSSLQSRNINLWARLQRVWAPEGQSDVVKYLLPHRTASEMQWTIQKIGSYSALVYTFVTSSRSSIAPSNFSSFSAFSPSTGT